MHRQTSSMGAGSDVSFNVLGHYHENMVVEKKFVMLYEQIIRLK